MYNAIKKQLRVDNLINLIEDDGEIGDNINHNNVKNKVNYVTNNPNQTSIIQEKTQPTCSITTTTTKRNKT